MNTTPTPKKRKEINKETYWMYKLHRFCYGENPDFKGYCPLFWSTWLLIILLPFIMVGKTGEFLFELIKSFVPEKSEKEVKPIYRKPPDQIIVIAYELFAEGFSDDDSDYYVNYNKYVGKLKEMDIDQSDFYFHRLEGWIEQNPNWKDFYPAALENLKKQKQREEAAEKRRLARQEFTDKISKYLSWTIKPILFASVLGLGFGIYKSISYLVSNINYGELLYFLWVGFQAILVIILFTGLIAFFKFVITYVVRKLSSIPENPKVVQNTEPGIFSKAIYAVGEAIDFVITTVKIIYKKECPLIVFVDTQTKPIEKND